MPHVSGGGSHSGGHRSSSSGGSRSFGGSHSSGYRSSSSGGSRSYGGSHSGGYRSSSSGGSRSYGGSHSGGYRSSSSGGSRGYGGSHSGSRSSGGYRSSPGSGSFTRSAPRNRITPGPIASAAAFAGAKRYVYYRNKKPQYVYSNYETYKPEFHFFRFLFWLFILICAFSVLRTDINEAMHPDQTVSQTVTQTAGPGESVIADTVGVIGDQDALMASLEAFRKVSGITPCVGTLYNENWQNEYNDLDTKALDFYVQAFQDEKHWVVLYSQPMEPDPSFNDWYWSAVQGDETPKLTASLADSFGETLQKYLMADSRYTVGDAMRLSFDALTAKMTPEQKTTQTKRHGWRDVIVCALMILGIAYIGGRRSGIIRKRQKRPAEVPEDAVAADPGTEEITCEYCGGVYLTDALKCPHCGAARTKKTD